MYLEMSSSSSATCDNAQIECKRPDAGEEDLQIECECKHPDAGEEDLQIECECKRPDIQPPKAECELARGSEKKPKKRTLREHMDEERGYLAAQQKKKFRIAFHDDLDYLSGRDLANMVEMDEEQNCVSFLRISVVKEDPVNSRLTDDGINLGVNFRSVYAGIENGNHVFLCGRKRTRVVYPVMKDPSAKIGKKLKCEDGETKAFFFVKRDVRIVKFTLRMLHELAQLPESERAEFKLRRYVQGQEFYLLPLEWRFGSLSPQGSSAYFWHGEFAGITVPLSPLEEALDLQVEHFCFIENKMEESSLE